MDKKRLVEIIFDIIKESDVLPSGNALISEKTSLYSECGLSSLGIVDLIICIEERFNIEFDETELELSKFESISNIADLVLTKL